jgi:hypothetical protein
VKVSSDMGLSQKRWEEFAIKDLFIVKIGKNIDGNKVNKQSGKTAYITRKEEQNGLDGFINFDKDYLNTEYPVITIGNETAKPFVQMLPFYTGTKVNILKSKKNISVQVLRFISQCLAMQKVKYSYSFTINSTRLKKQKILLPTTPKGTPDYAFMEAYIRHKEQKKLKEYQGYITKRLERLGGGQ